MEQNDIQGHGPETSFLIILAAGLRVFSMANFDQVTHVVLTCGEICSVTLIVIINWDKALAVLIRKKIEMEQKLKRKK